MRRAAGGIESGRGLGLCSVAGPQSDGIRPLAAQSSADRRPLRFLPVLGRTACPGSTAGADAVSSSSFRSRPAFSVVCSDVVLTRQASVSAKALHGDGKFQLVLRFNSEEHNLGVLVRLAARGCRLDRGDEVILPGDRPPGAGSRPSGRTDRCGTSYCESERPGGHCRDADAEGVGLEGGRRRSGLVLPQPPGTSSPTASPLTNSSAENCRLPPGSV